MQVHSQGEEKTWGHANLEGKFVSAPQAESAPQGRARVQFLRKMGKLGRFGLWKSLFAQF